MPVTRKALKPDRHQLELHAEPHVRLRGDDAHPRGRRVVRTILGLAGTDVGHPGDHLGLTPDQLVDPVVVTGQLTGGEPLDRLRRGPATLHRDQAVRTTEPLLDRLRIHPGRIERNRRVDVQGRLIHRLPAHRARLGLVVLQHLRVTDAVRGEQVRGVLKDGERPERDVPHVHERRFLNHPDELERVLPHPADQYPGPVPVPALHKGNLIRLGEPRLRSDPRRLPAG